MKRTRRVCVAALGLACAGAAWGQRAVVTPGLEVRPVAKLLALSDRAMEVEEHSGSVRRLGSDDAIALTQAEERAVRPLAGAGWLELVDGQRYVGRPADLASDGESVAWLQRDFGVLWVPLERVSRLAPPGSDAGGTLAPVVERDAVYLSNGDVVSGYLVSAGQEFVVEDDDGAVTVTPIALVSSVRLANRAEAPEGLYLWMADGSVLAAESVIDVSGERLQVELRTGETAVLPASQVLGMTRDAARLRGLASLPWSLRLPEERRWSAGARALPVAGSDVAAMLFAPDLAAPGPMRLAWMLPEGAARLGAIVEMADDAFPWGDCEVVVRSGGVEVFRERLWEESPRATIGVELRSRELEIEVEAGERGPVRDSVLLVSPFVLFESR